MGVNQPTADRFRWQLYKSRWECYLNCCTYYSRYVMEAGYYGAITVSGRLGEFTNYRDRTHWYGFVDTKGIYPHPLYRVNYYPYPYYPKNSWQGKRTGTITMWSVTLEWSEENYLVVLLDNKSNVIFGIRVRDADHLPYTEPYILA